MLKRSTLILFLLIPHAWGAAPDTAPGPAANVLTWRDCVQWAARNNPDLLSALQSIASSRAQYRGSYNGVLPHLSLENSYSKSSSSQVGVLSNGLSGTITNKSTQWQLDGSVSLDLVDVGQWASIQTAFAQLHQSQANAEVTATNLLLSLYKAYTALLYAQEESRVNISIRDTWQSNAQMVALRYDSGAESKGDKMNTEANFLQAQTSVSQAQRDILVAQQQLSQVIGQDDFEALVVTGTWAAPSAPTTMPNIEALLAQQPQIHVQEAVVEQARAAIRSARSTVFPTLSLNYNRGVVGSTELPSDPFWTFTGTVNYPLFSNGLTSTYYANQAASRAYDKAQQDLRSLRNQLRTNLVTAWTGYAQAKDAVNVQLAFLKASEQRKGEADINYQSGLLTFENWILIVEDYVNSQTNILRAEENLLLAEAQWRFAAGEQLQ